MVDPQIAGYMPSQKSYLVEGGNIDISVDLPVTAYREGSVIRMSGNLNNSIAVEEPLTAGNPETCQENTPVDDEGTAPDAVSSEGISTPKNVTVNNSVNFKGCRFYNGNIGFNGVDDEGTKE